jgi:uncharacterized protein (TIGR03437 family)
VAYSNFNSIVVARGSAVRHIAPPDAGNQPVDAVIDAAGSTVVFNAGPSLYLADATGSGSSLIAADGFAPVLSDDGKQLLYLSRRTGSVQIRLARLAGPMLDRQLGFVTGGVASATLSGDGSVAFAVAHDGRLLKIAATTGLAQELIPRTPHLEAISQLAPGKLVTVGGGGITDLAFVADPPLPATIIGVSMTVQGKAARLLGVSPDAILAIIPPDLTPGSGISVQFVLPSSSPFDTSSDGTFDVLTSAPEFVPVFAHQDWSGLVSADSPARTGEALHTYGVGFGATSPAVAFGAAAPSQEPFARLTTPFTCGGVEVFYQGLAPGLAGIYQFDFRVPASVSGGSFTLSCAQGGQTITAKVPVAAQ